MSVYRSTNKKTGITYVIESHSYWDKELKAPRNTKKVIGKIDPVTGEMVETRKRGSKSNESAEDNSVDYKTLYENALKDLEKKEKEIQTLKEEISSLLSSDEELLKEAINSLKTHSVRISTAARKYSV